jgi:hypothetical protein
LKMNLSNFFYMITFYGCGRVIIPRVVFKIHAWQRSGKILSDMPCLLYSNNIYLRFFNS